jgi:Nif-specific regulatory protein
MDARSRAFLTMINGANPGARYPLDPAAENRIGRGLDCQITLNDPRCSRVHAIVIWQEENWWLRDAGSRNGTFCAGQKIDEALLYEGCQFRTGASEFEFHDSTDTDTKVTQTIVRDTPLGRHDPATYVGTGLADSVRTQDLLLLHQLSLKLIPSSDPDEVLFDAMEILLQRMHASLVGFLSIGDTGQLMPKRVIPNDWSERVHLSEELTDLVSRKGHAVWLDTQTLIKHKGSPDHAAHFADAICVPLVHEDRTIGAIHIYLESGRFDQNEYEFAIAVASMVGDALARARLQTVLKTEHRRLIAKSGSRDEMIGESKLIQDLRSRIQRVGRAQGCVLIRGESGCGKELVARAIHRSSARSDRPMLTVNCAAIPRDLMESQLFGHRKGAFTGADADHVGWFQQADSSTLFLDEVGELTLEGQAKLLRILEGHPFLPVGATREISVDVRVIAATNRDLGEFVRDGRFREDLYYRLSVFELLIPALRDRGEDIGTLIDYFLEHFRVQHGRPGLELAPAARAKLLEYRWPGNVRQLRNVIDSAVVMAENDQIQLHDLGLRDVGNTDRMETLRLDFWERKLIQEALLRTQNNVPEAAKLLGIGRATLYRKLDEYQIAR